MSSERSEVQVTPGTEADLPALTDIYNHYVRETAFTFDIDPFTTAQRRQWLLSYPADGPYRLFVAREASAAPTRAPEPSLGPTGRVLGYATSSRFRPKRAYDTSVEVSVYCDPAVGVGRGVGTLLYQRLFQSLEGQDLHRAYAGLALPNDASVRLHTRFGFELVGTYREAGRKFGRYWDVARYEKPLGPAVDGWAAEG